MNKPLFPLLLAGLCLGACSRTPEGVLSTEELASLLCDLQITEAYYAVEGVPGVGRAGLEENDSVKKVLRQSVLARHGVSQPQFETTLDWYGRNLDRYEDVCERSMQLIEERKQTLAAASRKGESEAAASLWNGPLSLRMSGTTGRDMACFSITGEGIGKGDRLEWSFGTTALTAPIDVVMAVDYSDGSTSVRTHRVTGEGRQRLPLQTDSALTPLRLYGYLRVSQHSPLLLDSIALKNLPMTPVKYYDIHTQKTLR